MKDPFFLNLQRSPVDLLRQVGKSSRKKKFQVREKSGNFKFACREDKGRLKKLRSEIYLLWSHSSCLGPFNMENVLWCFLCNLFDTFGRTSQASCISGTKWHLIRTKLQNLNEKTEIDAKHADLKSHKLIRTTIPKESFVQYCFTIKLPVIFVFQVPGR